jgi:tetraacyldisaccharide 4'-kinase
MSARGIERLWYDGSRLLWPLWPMSWLFGLAVRIRRAAYRRGWLEVRRLPVPVVVVGNITVGGTGKTPVVEWLVRQLQAGGCRPGIVSRGYGARRRTEPVMVTARSAAEDVGDEPLLLARRTGAPVCVGADRVRAAQRLVAAGANVIVADDGLQHYRLARDLEIIVVDGRRGLGNGRMLPAGPLREPRARLNEAGFVLVNDGVAGDAGAGFSLSGDAAVNLASGETQALSNFAGRQVLAVAGIGNPQRFYAHLRAAGIEAVPVPVADHGCVDLGALARSDARAVLMTEKDAVKYRRGDHPSAWYVPVQVRMPADVATRIMVRVRSLLDVRTTAGGAAVG